MALITPNLDYSDRDFYSLRLRLQSLVRSVFPSWNNFNQANFGNILLELMAYVGDTLHHYQDKQVAEAYWTVLTQRISAIRQGALIGFSFTGAAAATGTFRVSTPYPNVTETAVISQGHRFINLDLADPVYYQATEEVTLAIGESYVDVLVEASEIKTVTFESTDEPGQTFTLPLTPFLDGSIDSVVRVGSVHYLGVVADNGDYALAESFLGASSTSKIFLLFVDQNDRAHLRFGNGATGTIPQGNITIKYKVGGGTAGNAELGTKFSTVDPIVFSGGGQVTHSIVAVTEISGGTARMSIEEARAKAPASLSAQKRCVSGFDFESAALSRPGVARALMATSNEYPGIEENTGILYIVAQGARLSSGATNPAAPSQALLDDIVDYITTEQPPTVTFTFSAVAAIFKTITVTARVYLTKNASESTVGAAIRTALADFFACQLPSTISGEEGTGAPNSYMDFGVKLAEDVDELGEIAWSDVLNAIRDVTGVKKVDEGATGLLLNSVRDSVTLLPMEFPKLGSVVLYNGSTGVAF